MADDPWNAAELELITRGRATGKPHRVRVWFAQEDGVLWLRTDERTPDWLKNLEAHPDCVVRIGGREREARYERVEGRDDALRHLVDLWRAKYGTEWVQPWYVETGREPVRLRLQGSALD